MYSVFPEPWPVLPPIQWWVQISNIIAAPISGEFKYWPDFRWHWKFWDWLLKCVHWLISRVCMCCTLCNALSNAEPLSHFSFRLRLKTFFSAFKNIVDRSFQLEWQIPISFVCMNGCYKKLKYVFSLTIISSRNFISSVVGRLLEWFLIILYPSIHNLM